MALARHGSGPSAALRAFASQVHPVFMLPAVAGSLVGGLLSPSFDLVLATVHAIAIFAALYTAHVKDGMVDFYWRGEDDDHPLTVRGCRVGLLLAGGLFVLTLVSLWVTVDEIVVLLTLPGWIIGYFHAPQFDTRPITATLGYPTGIALSILGGQYVQSTAISPMVFAIAVVVLVLLAGIKVIDDATDYEYDRSIDKRTAAVVLGRRRARDVGFGLTVVAMAGVIGLAVVLPAMPTSSILAAVAFGIVVLLARNAEPELATMLLIRGSYLFLAVLLATVVLRPLG